MAGRQVVRITNSPLTPAQRRHQVQRYQQTERRYRAEAERTMQKMAAGGVVRLKPMAGGGVAGVPDVDFQVLDDYLRGVLVAVLENMASVLPWPIRKLVTELLDAGRAPTVDEFKSVLSAVERLV